MEDMQQVVQGIAARVAALEGWRAGLQQLETRLERLEKTAAQSEELLRNFENNLASAMREIELMRERQRIQEANYTLAAQKIEEIEARLQHLNANSGGAVDTRVLGKPQTFSGETDQWRDWSFIFTAFTGAVGSPLLVELMWAAEEEEIIKLKDMQPSRLASSAQIWYMLVMLCRGKALDLCRAVGEQGNGLEAWRQLLIEFEPRTKGRFGGLLAQVLNFSFGEDVNNELNRFESAIKRYQDSSTEVLPDSIKVGIVMNNMKDANVQNHLYLNSKKFDTFHKVKDELRDYAFARRRVDDPMDVGALKGSPKGDGKGKKDTKTDSSAYAKAKAKAGAAAKAKAKAAAAAKAKAKAKGAAKAKAGAKKLVCWGCGEEGHPKKDCPNKGQQDDDGVKALLPATTQHMIWALTDDVPSPTAEDNLRAALRELEQLETDLIAALSPDADELPADSLEIDEIEEIFTFGAVQAISGQVDYSQWLQEDECAVIFSGEKEATDELAELTTARKRIQFLIDSGSVCHACPVHFAPYLTLLPPMIDLNLRTATGAPVKEYGRKKLELTIPGADLDITLHVKSLDVTKLILSVSKLNDVGLTVTFAPKGGWLLKDSIQIRLTRQRDTFWLEADLKVPAELVDLLVPLQPGQAESSSSGASSSSSSMKAQVAPEARDPNVPTAPIKPTKEEQDLHKITHIPMRSWCDFCVRAKAQELDHALQKVKGLLPLIAADWMYTGKEADEKSIPTLNLCDRDTGALNPSPAPSKAPTIYTVYVIDAFISGLGYLRIIFQTDQEPAMLKLQMELMKYRHHQIVPQKSPKYSHESNGLVENGNKLVHGQVRVLILQVEDNYEIILSSEHVIMYWIIRHSGFLLNRFGIKHDGHCPYYHIKGKEYNGLLVEMAEVVWFKDSTVAAKAESQWQSAVWLGKDNESDEHLLGFKDYLEAVKARSIRRKPEGRGPGCRFERKYLDELVALPWGKAGQIIERSAGVRRKYITRAAVRQHGATRGCAGCEETSSIHNSRCRDRFEKIFAQELAAAPKAALVPPPAPIRSKEPEPSGEGLQPAPELSKEERFAEAQAADVEMDNEQQPEPAGEDGGMQAEEELDAEPLPNSEEARRGVRRAAPARQADEPRDRREVGVKAPRLAPNIAGLTVPEDYNENVEYLIAAVECCDYDEEEEKAFLIAKLSDVEETKTLTPSETYQEYEKLPLSNFENCYDEYTGLKLDAKMVKEGDLRELASHSEFQVYLDVPTSRRDQNKKKTKTIGARWLRHMALKIFGKQ